MFELDLTRQSLHLVSEVYVNNVHVWNCRKICRGSRERRAAAAAGLDVAVADGGES